MTSVSGACPETLVWRPDPVCCYPTVNGRHRIAVFLPVSQKLSRMAGGGEQRFVEAFISQPAAETFDKSVLLQFSQGDMMSFDLHLISSF